MSEPSTNTPPRRTASRHHRHEHQGLKIHLATFHQSVIGIYDQILFLKLLFRTLDLPFTIGDALDPNSLNLMIEYFPPSVCETVDEFCQTTGKRISIVVTEHLDYRDGRIFAYGEPLFEQTRDRDYIPHAETARRFAGLVQAAHSSHMLLTLGDYPRLRGAETMFPRCPLVALPFPPLPMDTVVRRTRHKPRYDFVFTGTVTRFRRRVLDMIEASFSVAVSKLGLNYIERGRNYLRSSLALNVPQYPGWIWSSPMRILYGLTNGRLTVSPFLRPDSEIDQFALMPVDLSVSYLREVLAAANPASTLETVERYQAFAEDKLRHTDVHKAFRDWGLVEGLI